MPPVRFGLAAAATLRLHVGGAAGWDERARLRALAPLRRTE